MQEYDEWFAENEIVVISLPFLGELTWNELHAIELGMIGLFRPTNPLFYILLYLIISNGNAHRTVQHEPWYFLVTSIVMTLFRRYIL